MLFQHNRIKVFDDHIILSKLHVFYCKLSLYTMEAASMSQLHGVRVIFQDQFLLSIVGCTFYFMLLDWRGAMWPFHHRLKGPSNDNKSNNNDIRNIDNDNNYLCRLFWRLQMSSSWSRGTILETPKSSNIRAWEDSGEHLF